MLKKTIIITSLLSFFIFGCSTDQRYKREVEGNDNYLKSPELKPLIVPNGLKVPLESGEYHVYKAAKESDVGKDIDIRPPVLPLSIITDSYAVYDEGMVKADLPEYSGFWSQIPSILKNHYISVEHQDNKVIKTGVRFISRGDELPPVEASYLIQRETNGGREYITIELVSLKQAGQDISSIIESQRYTVEFFNLLMRDFSAQSTTTVSH